VASGFRPAPGYALDDVAGNICQALTGGSPPIHVVPSRVVKLTGQGWLLRTSTRPTLNRRAESPRLCEHSTRRKVVLRSRSSAGSQRSCCRGRRARSGVLHGRRAVGGWLPQGKSITRMSHGRQGERLVPRSTRKRSLSLSVSHTELNIYLNSYYEYHATECDAPIRPIILQWN